MQCRSGWWFRRNANDRSMWSSVSGDAGLRGRANLHSLRFRYLNATSRFFHVLDITLPVTCNLSRTPRHRLLSQNDLSMTFRKFKRANLMC